MNPMNQMQPQQVNPGAMPAAAEPQEPQVDQQLVEMIIDRMMKLTNADAAVLDMALSNDAVVDVLEKIMPEVAAAFEIIDQNTPDQEEGPINMAGQGQMQPQGANPLVDERVSRGLMG